MNNRKFLPLLIYMAALVLVLSWASGLLSPNRNAVPYSRVLSLFEQEQVRSFVVEGDSLTLYLNSPYEGKTTLSTTLGDPDAFRRELINTKI